MIRTSIYFLLMFFLMGVSIFATQNQQLVNLKFSPIFISLESINLPLGLVLIFSAGLGSIAITGLQVSNFKVPQSEVSSTKTSSSRAKPQPAKPFRDRNKDEIKDFDDDFDDDWG